MSEPEPPAVSVRGIVLIVDDNPGVLETLAAGFPMFGLEVLTADGYQQAMHILRSDERVDLLLSDVVMPGDETGIYLAREARRVRPGLPVLLMTGYAFDLLQELGSVKNEFEVIAKPCSFKTLAPRIWQLIGQNEPADPMDSATIHCPS